MKQSRQVARREMFFRFFEKLAANVRGRLDSDGKAFMPPKRRERRNMARAFAAGSWKRQVAERLAK